jgi:hypothetical protein
MATNNATNTTLSGQSGTGSYAGSTSPTFTTPDIGVATATSVNKMAITAPGTSSTLTVANGKTFTVSNTMTQTSTDSANIAFGTGGTVAYVGGTGVLTTSTITTSQTAAVNNAYITNSGSLITVTLPTTFAIGDIVKLKGLGAGKWTLTAGSATTVQFGNSATSSAGSLAADNQYDTIQISGLVANATWSVDYVQTKGLTVT